MRKIFGSEVKSGQTSINGIGGLILPFRKVLENGRSFVTYCWNSGLISDGEELELRREESKRLRNGNYWWYEGRVLR